LISVSKDLLPEKVDKEKEIRLNLQPLKGFVVLVVNAVKIFLDAPPYFIGNIEVRIDVKESADYSKSHLM